MRFLVRYQSTENCSSRLINSVLVVHVCPSLCVQWSQSPRRGRWGSGDEFIAKPLSLHFSLSCAPCTECISRLHTIAFIPEVVLLCGMDDGQGDIPGRTLSQCNAAASPSFNSIIIESPRTRDWCPPRPPLPLEVVINQTTHPHHWGIKTYSFVVACGRQGSRCTSASSFSSFPQ